MMSCFSGALSDDFFCFSGGSCVLLFVPLSNLVGVTVFSLRDSSVEDDGTAVLLLVVVVVVAIIMSFILACVVFLLPSALDDFFMDEVDRSLFLGCFTFSSSSQPNNRASSGSNFMDLGLPFEVVMVDT